MICSTAAPQVSVVQVDFLGESTEGNLHLVSRATSEAVNVLNLSQPEDILSVPLADVKDAQQARCSSPPYINPS